MSYPLGYDPRGLCAIVTIQDIDDVEVARYEMPQVVAGAPTQDFVLLGVNLNMGINSNHGQIDVFIDDRDREQTEIINGREFSIYKAGFTVKVFCGKDETSLSLWALGVLQDVDLMAETGLLTQALRCLGYGVRTQQRFSIMNRTQKRLLTDGITPDPSDKSTYVSQIFKDTLEKTDHLATPGLGQLDITTENVDEIPIAIPEYHKNLVSFGSILTEMASMGYCFYGVDQFKKAYLFKRGSKASAFLISNDVTNPAGITANWDPDKLMFFRNRPLLFHDTSTDSAHSILHFVGSQKLFVDYNQQIKDAEIDTAIRFNAFPFTPETDNVAEIGLFLLTLNPIDADLEIAIVGDDGTGSPNINNLRKSIIIKKEQLTEELTPSGIFFNLKFDKIPVTHGEKLFLIILKSANTNSDAVSLTYEPTDFSDNFFDSSDGGITWIERAGTGTMITYNSKNTRIIAENTVAAKKLIPKEGTVTMPDTPNQETVLQIAQAMLETLSKIVRNYDPISVSAPTTQPELGKTIRLIDVTPGTDTNANLIGYQLSINALDQSNRGAATIKLILQEQFS